MNIIRHTFTPLQQVFAVMAIFALMAMPMAQVFATEEAPADSCDQEFIYTKYSDFDDTRVKIDYKQGNKITVSEKTGYIVTKVELDVTGDYVMGYKQYATGPVSNFDPDGTTINGARVTVKKVCDKVTICHATGSGFVVNTPNKTADAGGHAGISHQDGEDIIPPFDYDAHGTKPAGHFDGQNWDAEGQAIYNDGKCDGTYIPPTCPDGYTGTYPECVPPPCPDGYTGTYPECVPPPPMCPDGYTGTYPECVAPPTCPDGYTGTYPECLPPPTCPDGYTGTYPECVPPPCPDGYTGTYPECVPPPPMCPDGYTGTYPECVPPQSDPQCSDGDDNDDDGLIDESDPGCDDETDDDESNSEVPSVCKIGNNLLANSSFEDPVLTGNWDIFNPIAEWIISLSNGLELWANGFYGGASDGNQNAELDGNAPTMITQSVVTIPGATYELRFDFSARPDADSAANNSVDALVDNVVLMNATASGADIITNTWKTYAKTFVAADASTDISLKDVGTADSLGSLVDNAVLCLVKEPVVDYCPNIEGNQTENDGYLKDINNQCYTPINSCTLSVVSDTTNLEDGEAALLVTPHPVWVPNIAGSLAKWIWGSSVDTPIDPVNDETQTFTKTFVWSGTPSTAVLTIASDNGYSVKLNGLVVGSDAGEYNYSATDTIIDITDNLIVGVNTLEISVTNKANGATSLNIQNGNPAGLLYDLTITNTTDPSCAPNPVYPVTGYKFNDLNNDGDRDEGEPLLSGWTIEAKDGEVTHSDITDSEGNYSFNLPAGDWTIGEVNPTNSGWTQTAPIETGVCEFTFGGESEATSGTCNFGNHQNGDNNGGDSTLSCSLITSINPVKSGQEFELSWTATGAVSAQLDGESVETTGSLLTSLTNSTTYKLIVSDEKENTKECTVTVDRRSSGGGGGSSSRRSSNDGEVLGDSTQKGEVLGDATSTLPVGAPNTGAGGTSPVVPVLPSFLAILSEGTGTRRVK